LALRVEIAARMFEVQLKRFDGRDTRSGFSNNGCASRPNHLSDIQTEHLKV
jgi:hypothetical protein